MNLILWLISLLTISGYLLYVVWRFGAQSSISYSYYKIKHKPVFSFVMMFTAFPLMILSSTGLMFFAGAALLFVSVAPAFMRDDSVNRIHNYSAYSAVILTMLSIIFDYEMLYMILPFVIFGLAILFKVIKISNEIWWMEIVAFTQIFVVLFINKML